MERFKKYLLDMNEEKRKNIFKQFLSTKKKKYKNVEDILNAWSVYIEGKGRYILIIL